MVLSRAACVKHKAAWVVVLLTASSAAEPSRSRTSRNVREHSPHNQKYSILPLVFKDGSRVVALSRWSRR